MVGALSRPFGVLRWFSPVVSWVAAAAWVAARSGVASPCLWCRWVLVALELEDSVFLFMGRLIAGRIWGWCDSYTEPLGNRHWGCGSHICCRHQDALAAATAGDTGAHGSLCCHGDHGRRWKPLFPQVLRSLGWLRVSLFVTRVYRNIKCVNCFSDYVGY